MRKIPYKALLPAAALIAAVLAFSCSGEMNDNKTEKTESIETRTAEIGREAAEAIKMPMEEVQDAVNDENERMREYEKRLNE